LFPDFLELRHISHILFIISDSEFWVKKAQSTLSEKLRRKAIIGQAKNVIMFLGDGFSIPTLAAARAYLGQSQGATGEETVLSFEEFPNTGLSKVRHSGAEHPSYLTDLLRKFQFTDYTEEKISNKIISFC
jgi:alkaline phosphatase